MNKIFLKIDNAIVDVTAVSYFKIEQKEDGNYCIIAGIDEMKVCLVIDTLEQCTYLIEDAWRQLGVVQKRGSTE